MTVNRVRFLDSFGITQERAPKQLEFIEQLTAGPHQTVLFGGSGYSGKTRTLIIASVYLLGKLKTLGFPGQRIFFGSLSYPQIIDRIVPQFDELFGHMGRLSDSRRHGLHWSFTDPELGVVAFRNLADPNQRKGSGFAGVLVDELTELTRRMFGDLQYIRLQRSEQKLPWMPFGAATNPDGIGHGWTKKIFVERDFTGIDAEIDPKSIFFVPALPDDNPAFSEESFNLATASLPEHVRRARRTGSWDTPEGARWPILAPSTHQFKMRERFPYGLPSSYPILMGIDYGQRAPYAALWVAIDQDRNGWLFREDYEAGLTASQQAKRVLSLTAPNERIRWVRMDPAMWQAYQRLEVPKELKSAVHNTPYNDFKKVLGPDPRFGPIMKAYNDMGGHISRQLGQMTLDRVLHQDNGHPNLMIEEGCKNTWAELSGAVWDQRSMYDDKKEDIDVRQADHAITALIYGIHAYYEGAEPARPQTLEEQMAKAAAQEYKNELYNAEREIADNLRHLY